MIRRRFIKASVSSHEFQSIQGGADAAGLTVAAFTRAALARAVTQEHGNESLEVASREVAGVMLKKIAPDFEEILQLTRLIASHTSPQAASRLTASINQQREGNQK